jgi:hypothetical protein
MSFFKKSNQKEKMFFQDRASAHISLSRIKEFCYRQAQVTVIQRLPKPTPFTLTTLARGYNYMKTRVTEVLVARG